MTLPRTAAEFRAQAEEERRRLVVQANTARIAAKLVLLPLASYVLMLATGAVHGVSARVPTVGYGTTLLGLLGLEALAYVTRIFRR